MSGGIKIPVAAVFDKGQSDQALKDFTAQFNKVGEAIAKANKQKFTPVDKLALQDVQKMAAAFQSLQKVSPGFASRIKATGQAGAGFLDLDWSKMYADSAKRARAQLQHFNYVTGGAHLTPLLPAPGAAPAPAPTPAGVPATRPGSQPVPAGGGDGSGGPPSQTMRVVRAGLNATGIGSAANGAISEGMRFGVGAGLAGLVGGLAALAVGKAIAAVREKIGAAQQEFIGLDTLKRQLGDVNVGFGSLKESLRGAARNVDLTFDESLQLGQQFTKLSGITGEQAKDLGEEVQNAAGFSRSFGLDPAAGNAAFAQMRLSRVTQNVEDSRRMGLVIGEAIARSGAFSQVEQLLDAVTGFVGSQTRQGLVSANATGYLGALSGLVGSGIPGLDVAGAAQLLGRVNSAIAGGGAAGEAGQNFMYSAIGSRLGLNPIQTAIMREQGAFGTGASTFGAGSAYSRFAEKYGLQVPEGAASSSATNLQLITEQLKRNYAGRPELMVNAMSNLLGVNTSQAMALATVDPKALGGLSERMRKSGVSLSDVNATGISRIAQIEADGSLSETEKDRLIKEAATQNQEETEGSRTRASINGVERAVQSAASLLVGPLNDIRSAVMLMAGEGKMSPREILEAVARTESKDREGRIMAEMNPRVTALNAELAAARSNTDSLRLNAPPMSSTPEEKQAHAAKIADAAKKVREVEERLNAARQQMAERISAEGDRLNREIANIRAPQAHVDGAKEDEWRKGNWSWGGVNDPRSLDKGGGGASAPNERHSLESGAGGKPAKAVSGDFSALANAEGLNAEQTKLAYSIFGQESGFGTNTATSVNGAMGDMQMLPSTFKAYSDPGWDINNPEHNRRAAMRYIKDLWKKSGGNPRTTAGAYYGGEKAIGPGGKLKEYRNLKRPSDPSTLEYADSVVGRMRNLTLTPAADVLASKAPGLTPAADVLGAPAGEQGGSGGRQVVELRGEFQLRDRAGAQAAQPVQVSSVVKLPSAAGAMR